mmetsp:Transcript_61896/g.100097  ORF Transcript_61896/g.100097 Transcript_61896/m.100097 type:complete len:201 (-) Transcript_61896:575-1177(-)
MSLRQLAAVRGEDQRHVTELRSLEAQAFINQDLPGRVHQVLLGSENVADGHLRIIHNHTKVVHWSTALSDDDEVASEVVRVPSHLPKHQVVHHDLPVEWNSKSVHVWHSLVHHGLDLILLRVSPWALYNEGLLVPLRLCSHGIELLWGKEALVGISLCNHLVKLFLVNTSLDALRLPVRTRISSTIRTLIPSDAAPLQAL